MAQYNPYAVRRTVRVAGDGPDGIVAFVSKSFTRPDNWNRYHPVVDTVTGEVMCNCRHFRYRLSKMNPHANDRSTLCKHLKRAVATLKRHSVQVEETLWLPGLS